MVTYMLSLSKSWQPWLSPPVVTVPRRRPFSGLAVGSANLPTLPMFNSTPTGVFLSPLARKFVTIFSLFGSAENEFGWIESDYTVSARLGKMQPPMSLPCVRHFPPLILSVDFSLVTALPYSVNCVRLVENFLS